MIKVILLVHAGPANFRGQKCVLMNAGYSVNDRPNGATHDRLNGATLR